VRVPDVAVLRAPDLTAVAADRSALFLAVEIADTTLRNDLGRKLRAYAAAGVPHYWVADLKGRRLHVMAEPAEAGYARSEVMPFGTPMPVPGTQATVTFG
jgi:Uma2 family endonuclease